MAEGGFSGGTEEQLFLLEAGPGDEGREEIILTMSRLNVEEQEDKPASDPACVEKATSPKDHKKAKGRPVPGVGEAAGNGAALPSVEGGGS